MKNDLTRRELLAGAGAGVGALLARPAWSRAATAPTGKVTVARLLAGPTSRAPAPMPAPASNSLLVKCCFIAVSFASRYSNSMAPYTASFGRNSSNPPASWGAHARSTGAVSSGLTRRATLCRSFR